jgi:hypothetical protein
MNHDVTFVALTAAFFASAAAYIHFCAKVR